MDRGSAIETGSFERFGGACALLAAVAGLAYSVSFVIYLHNGSRGAAYADAFLLLAGGLLSIAAFCALYPRLRAADEGFALLGFVLAIAGALGAALHGGYDLANLANPPTALATDVPSSTDPRGLGTFALTGAALAVAGWLIVRSRVLPVRLGQLALLAAVLLVYVYVGRLVILDPKDPALLTAAAAVGFVVNPVWFAWLGLLLWRSPKVEALPSAAT
jgi:hypothetical protein